MRFLAVGNLRGAIVPPVELDAAGQAAAFSRLRHDQSQDVRVAYELAMNDCRVDWNWPFSPGYEPRARVEKMMRLSARVG